MPTLSASDYTQYLKFKASAGSAIKPAIQTRDNVSLSQSLINAQLLASQAAFVTTPATTTVTTLVPTVSAASTTTVTAAKTDVITLAQFVGSGTYQYSTSQPHGLVPGQSITVSGLTQNLLSVSPNGALTVATVPSDTSFRCVVSGAGGTISSGTGSITGRVYYTTSVAHGLVSGDTVSITGITTFTASGATAVVAATDTTTFSLLSSATGTAVTGQTGSITGLVYYTTSAAHGLVAGTKFVSITGLTGTPAYNLSGATVFRTPSTTVFSVVSSATGTAITGATGVLAVTTYANQNMAVSGLARVQGPQVVQTRSNPDARSTLSFAGTSGALGSSATQRSGGLPTGFKNSQGTYTRLPQHAGW